MRRNSLSLSSVTTLGSLFFFVFIAGAELHADPVTYVDRGSAWRYFRGTQEASSPVHAWRLDDFDDAAWPVGDAPFGYGDPPFNTDVNAGNPTMRGNFVSIFLRKTFEVGDASRVDELEIDVNYDDGFHLWINGVHLLNVNMPTDLGEPVAYDDEANNAFKSGDYVLMSLPDPSDYLVDGTNTIAVMVFNNQPNSSDLKLDLELYDPDGIDVTPPVVETISPGAGATIRSLESIEISFNETVQGVNAGDLRINGQAASSVNGSGKGPYTFQLPVIAPGPVSVEWTAGHGIEDFGDPPNVFAGGSWAYTVDPDAPAADLVINELVATNLSGILDDDNETGDWFEIHNRGAEPVEVGGYSVTDDPDEPGKFVLPSRTIPAQGYLVVFATGKDRRPVSGEIHANFGTDADGEFLGLYSSDSPRIELFSFRPEFPPQRADVSYGLDGTGELVYFESPTPGTANSLASALDGIVADPIFNFERGFYDEGFDLEIASPTSDTDIRYTTNGTKPTPTRGTIYNGPIRIQGTTSRAVPTIRAIAYRSGYLSSRVVTHTYVFPEMVARQPSNPSGFPSSWNGATADYQMDPDVALSARYRDRLIDGLRSIPAISIVTDNNSIFGSSGIYTNSTQSGQNWERECSAEIFFPPGVEPPEGDRHGTQLDCGVRMQGGASRNPPRSPKHSFRLLFKGIYGSTKLRFKLFPFDTATESFDTITLRAGYNNSWIHSDGGQRNRAQYIRDQWVRDVLLDMGQVSSHGTYIHLYVNGLYWGIHNAVERPSAPFAASYLGGEKEEYDALNSAQAIDGDTRAWSELHNRAGQNLSILSNYERVVEYVNPVNLADYMIVNFYGANQDWDHHNWYAARRDVPGPDGFPGNQWHMFSWDAERIHESATSNILGENNGNQPSRVYQNMTQSPEFRLLVADRLHKHFFNGGTLTPQRAEEIWMARAEEIDEAVVAESARWGDYRRANSPYTVDGHWIPEQNRLRNSYFPVRTSNMLSYFRSRRLYPNVGAPIFNQFGGEVASGFDLTMRRPNGTNGTIYFTLDGTDPRTYGTSSVSPDAETYSSSIEILGSVLVKARIRNGSTWSALTEAFFTVPSLYESLRFTEISYHATAGGEYDFVEIKNVGTETVSLAGLSFSNGLDYVFGESELLAPGEFYVIASDGPSFETAYPGVPYDGVYGGSLSNSGERLTIRDPFDRLVLTAAYDDDEGWPISPDGFGYSLVLEEPDGDPDSPTSWRASANAFGSPGEDDPDPIDHGVVINETLSRSDDPLEDAIELYNPTGVAIDIGGWFLSDSRDGFAALRKYRIPDGTILPAGEYIVFYESDFNAAPGEPTSFALDGSGDQVYLASGDAARELTGYIVGVDFDAFDSGVSFGRVETSVGPDTSPLLDRSFGADDPIDVDEFRTGLGLLNSEPLVGPVVIHEVHYHPKEGGDEFIELYNLTDETIELYGTDSDGEPILRGWRLRGISNATGTESYEFPEGASVGPNGLVLIVSTSPEAFRLRHSVPDGVPVFGPFGGTLQNNGESVKLLRPTPDDAGETPYAQVDRVVYNDGFPWPTEADGEGPSLERRVAEDYGNEPDNWGASEPTGGTPGRGNSVGPPLPNQPPFAAFTATPDEGELPLEVSFDASASEDPDGNIVSYAWDFDDGMTGTGRLTSHVFQDAGTYQVELTVRDNDGAETTSSRSIVVTMPPPNELPVAAFTATPDSGETPLEVTFNASASDDPDGDIVSYTWDFDDGGSGSGRILTHRFDGEGVYQVRLTVEDDRGATDTATRTITVGPPPPNIPPIAEFTASPADGEAPLEVSFDATESSDPDGIIIAYLWDFDDGSSATGETVTHTFDAAGEYDVKLTVIDNDQDRTERVLRVSVRPDTSGGGQLPNDCNQDGQMDISDGVCLLRHLFLGDPAVLPCGDGALVHPGNTELFNANGDARVDLGDAIYVLNYLFQGGNAPTLGEECVRITGCPENCVP